MKETLTSHSILDLVLQAGPVVQLVMLTLLAASVVSWAIIFEKWHRFRRVSREAEEFEERFWSGGNVAKLFQVAPKEWPDSPLVVVFMAGFREWKRWEGEHVEGKESSALKEVDVADLGSSVRRSMTVALSREEDRLEHGLTFLATVGSTSPFIGLFGTVWGIMNAFLGLSAAKSTTLTMVAPGIAEALVATAIGLVAAIPAVVAYNKYAAELRRMHQKMDNFCSEFLNILERRAIRLKGGL